MLQCFQIGHVKNQYAEFVFLTMVEYGLTLNFMMNKKDLDIYDFSI